MFRHLRFCKPHIHEKRQFLKPDLTQVKGGNDRNRNAITTGSRVMVATNGATGVIKEICGEGKSEEQLRRSDCVSIEGVEGLFCPMDLVRLGFH